MRDGLKYCSLAAVLALGACAAPPTGPSVLSLPGQNKAFETFQQEDTTCRQYASSQPSGPTQQQYDMAYAQCMYAHGNYVASAPTSYPYGNGYPSYPYYFPYSLSIGIGGFWGGGSGHGGGWNGGGWRGGGWSGVHR